MRGFSKHERRWGSDNVLSRTLSTGSSPGNESNAAEEFVEVTLDFQDDDTIVLRSVEPAAAGCIDIDFSGDDETPTPASASASASVSRSPTIRRSSSNRLLQLSQELKAEAVAKAKQFSQELKAELRRFRSHGHASRTQSTSSSAALNGNAIGSAFESALAARALRRQRAQLDRTRSGAQKALRGLKFISNSKTNGVDAWNEVQINFEKLAKDGFLYRADFAQCIGFLFLFQCFSFNLCSSVNYVFSLLGS